MSPAETLAARLRERVDRYNAALDVDERADGTEMISPETAALRRELLVATLTGDGGRIVGLDEVDADHFWLAAWASEFRDNAFTTAGDDAHGRDEGAHAMRLFLVVDHVRPDLIPSFQRARIEAVTASGAVLDIAYRERELAEVMLGDERADLAGVDVAVTLLRRSVQRDAGDQLSRWHALMRALWRRYDLSADTSDVTAAIDAAERALALTNAGNRVITLRQIGVLEQIRYDRTGTAASLDRCIAVFREALDLAPPTGPDRADTLVGLGVALRSRGSRERSPEDLGRAVALIREALSDPSLGIPHRASALSMLALALHSRFMLTRGEQDLTEAVWAARAAVNSGVEEDRGVLLGNLGLVLGTCYHHRRDRDDLAELVSVARRAVALRAGRRERGIASGLLAVALTYQADASGRLADLNGAVAAARSAVADLAGHPERAAQQHNLVKALYDRFRRTQSIEDLDECIEVARRATTGAPSDDLDQAGRLSLLAGALENRYQLHGDLDDLLGAVAAGEAAVLSAAPSAAGHAAQLSNLSNTRRALAERTGQLADADAAIDVAARAVAIDGGGAARPVRLFNLAACHVVRYRVGGDVADLDKGVGMLREALAGVVVSDPNRHTYLSELGQRLAELYAAGSDRRLLGEAIRLLREAAGLTDAPAAERVRAAGRWGQIAARYDLRDEAVAGYAAGVRLLPLAAWHGLDRRSQERQLNIWNPIVTSAAARAVGRGQGGEALELLEQGRNVLWGQQLGRDVDLGALRAVRSDLAQRLDEVRSELESPPER